MTPTEAMELAEQVITETELAMLASEDPAELERLKAERAEAQRILALAEQTEAESRERERLARAPTPAQVWEEWQDLRFLSRRSLTPGMKAHIIQRFGVRNYERLPR